MPGFPGFFLLLGATLAAAPSKQGIAWGRFGWVYAALMSLVAMAALSLAWSGSWVTVNALRWAITAGAGLLLALVALGIAAERGHRIAMGLAVVLATACLVCFGKALRTEHPVIRLAPELAQVSGDKDLLAWGFTEPSLVFYSDRQWTMLSKMERVKERLAKGRAGAVVMLRREWTLSDRIKQWRTGSPITTSKDNQKEVDAVSASLPDARLVDVEGYNLARSSWVELRLIVPK